MENDKFEKVSKIAVSYFNQRKSLLMFVSTVDYFFLRKSAIEIANKCNKENPLPIFVVQGSIRGENGWPFVKLRKSQRIQLLQNGTMVTDTSGLILPQDVPIILLAEEFDQFDERDQLAYSHLVELMKVCLNLIYVREVS
jgi:hypothetical protein